MKGSLLWKFMYLFCALAGILAGYGIFSLAGGKEDRPDRSTKETKQPDIFVTQAPAITELPVVTQAPAITDLPVVTQAPVNSGVLTPKPTLPPPTATPAQKEPTTAPASPVATVTPADTEGSAEAAVDKLPSLGRQWAGSGEDVPEFPSPSVPTGKEPLTTQTITYPVQIFGQVPVINRSDGFVSYFEFAYDLIAIAEPVVSAGGENMNALLAQFVIKALFCGIDIEKLDINAPIPRRLAALCLWLGAQVLKESGSDTSSNSAEGYVIDISGCSAAEKKAVAYLYESGIMKGYGEPGQRFYPDDSLKTETGNQWLSAIKQLWK